MNFLEKFLVNSLFYSIFYRHTFLGSFLRFCDIKGKTLEIGCGIGFTSNELRKRFKTDLTAVDYDPEQIERAKKSYGGIRFIQGDGRALKLKDGEFDCVVEMNTFHHIEGFEKAVSESYRVLRKGGKFYMMDISRYFLWPFLCLIPFEHFDGKFTRDGMVAELEKAGFNIARKKGWDLFMIEAVKR